MVGGSAVAAVVALAGLSAAGETTLVWEVSPLRFPELAVAPVLAIALLAVPAVRPLADQREPGRAEARP